MRYRVVVRGEVIYNGKGRGGESNESERKGKVTNIRVEPL